MKNPILIKNAITAHFACDKKNLVCDMKLESFSNVAIDFLQYLMTGSRTDGFERAISLNRYKTKLILIERYIKQNKV